MWNFNQIVDIYSRARSTVSEKFEDIIILCTVKKSIYWCGKCSSYGFKFNGNSFSEKKLQVQSSAPTWTDSGLAMELSKHFISHGLGTWLFHIPK